MRRCALACFFRPRRNAGRVPVLYWLSGLTCTEENFIVKAGAQRVAAALGLGDRGARHEPARARHSGRRRQLRLRTWRRVLCRCDRGAVVTRLPNVFVHHGGAAGGRRVRVPRRSDREPASSDIRWAAMARSPSRSRIPRRYKSVSAFAPIASPMRCPWGQKALGRLSRRDRARWREYDATALDRRARLGRTADPGRSGNQRSSSWKAS